jgi:hypothetical protein
LANKKPRRSGAIACLVTFADSAVRRRLAGHLGRPDRASPAAGLADVGHRPDHLAVRRLAAGRLDFGFAGSSCFPHVVVVLRMKATVAAPVRSCSRRYVFSLVCEFQGAAR